MSKYKPSELVVHFRGRFVRYPGSGRDEIVFNAWEIFAVDDDDDTASPLPVAKLSINGRNVTGVAFVTAETMGRRYPATRHVFLGPVIQ
ncbi:MAG: hypothetical protein GY803_08055 [Chloroflexi bacterium]|nr:hypothetical protein [Chloroflexota bacterium]